MKVWLKAGFETAYSRAAQRWPSLVRAACSSSTLKVHEMRPQRIKSLREQARFCNDAARINIIKIIDINYHP